MATTDRMFQVIVLGGIALASVPLGSSVVGCGGAVTSSSADAAFPTEGPAPEPDAFPTEGPPPYSPDAFPQETATFIDSGIDSGIGRDATPDAFPQEGPAMIDAGTQDAFPQETAQLIDSGHDATDDAQG